MGVPGQVCGMCGRYTFKLSWKQIVELYRLTLPEEPPPLRESYNVAPTDVMPIIRPAGNGRERSHEQAFRFTRSAT